MSGHLSCSHSIRVGSSAPPTREVSLVCCPRKVQGPLFCVQQLVRGRASSPTLVTLGPAPGNKGHGGEGTFPSPMPAHGIWGGVINGVPTSSELTHLHPQQQLVCCPGEGEYLWLRGVASSPAAVSNKNGTVSFPRASEGHSQFSKALRFQQHGSFDLLW